MAVRIITIFFALLGTIAAAAGCEMLFRPAFFRARFSSYRRLRGFWLEHPDMLTRIVGACWITLGAWMWFIASRAWRS